MQPHSANVSAPANPSVTALQRRQQLPMRTQDARGKAGVMRTTTRDPARNGAPDRKYLGADHAISREFRGVDSSVDRGRERGV